MNSYFALGALQLFFVWSRLIHDIRVTSTAGPFCPPIADLLAQYFFRPVCSGRGDETGHAGSGATMGASPNNSLTRSSLGYAYATRRRLKSRAISRGVVARGAGDAAARVRARAAEIQALDRHAVVGVPRRGPQGVDLVRVQGAVEDVAAAQPELALEIERREHLAPDHRAREVGRVALDRDDDVIGGVAFATAAKMARTPVTAILVAMPPLVSAETAAASSSNPTPTDWAIGTT